MTGSKPAIAKPDAGVRTTSGQKPSGGNLRQRLRLWSGLVLFAFCLSHFLNHATGIISVSAMDAASLWHYAIWRSPVGELVLLIAALTHVGLALWRTARRRTLRLPPWEFTQLVLGLYIPWTLIPHMAVTVGLAKTAGFAATYDQMLTLLWPNGAVMQSILLLVVWSHAMIGLHFWLRLYPTYLRLRPLAAGFAIAVPILALWGWIEGARRLALVRTVQPKVTAEQINWAYDVTFQLRAVIFGLIVASLLVVLLRYLSRRFGRGITVAYPGNQLVRAAAGPTLLEMSRMNGIAHAAVCGGRARCSTCRVKILSGGTDLEPPGPAEATVLKRIGAEPGMRLACQIRPKQDIEVFPLVPARTNDNARGRRQDAYHWGVEQQVVVMFVDLRNFTGMTEAHLAYDIVFLLNQYLDRVSAAIRAEDGHVDKFIGDGIMALFGMDTNFATGARQALRAARRIGEVMEGLNAERGPQFKEPLRVGIGLHGGTAILGRIGAAGASGSRANLTALGDVVNTASRLEGANKEHGSTLAVSQTVLDAAGVALPEAIPAEIQLRGKETLLKIYTLKELNTLALPDDLDKPTTEFARRLLGPDIHTA